MCHVVHLPANYLPSECKHGTRVGNGIDCQLVCGQCEEEKKTTRFPSCDACGVLLDGVFCESKDFHDDKPVCETCMHAWIDANEAKEEEKEEVKTCACCTYGCETHKTKPCEAKATKRYEDFDVCDPCHAEWLAFYGVRQELTVTR